MMRRGVETLPLLERWALVVPSGRHLLATPDSPAVVLAGVVRGDLRFPNGAAIVTSRVLELDLSRARARTSGSRYRLGAPSRFFLRWVRAHGLLLADYARSVSTAEPREQPLDRARPELVSPSTADVIAG